MRLGFAIPWFDRGLWLFSHLPPQHTGQLLVAVGEKPSRLPPYLRELVGLSRYRLADHDLIFTWELRCTLAILLLRRWQHSSVRVIAVGPIIKGKMRFLVPLLRPLLRQAERIVCFSSAEQEEYAGRLDLPTERVHFVPTPWTAPDDVPAPTDAGFVLALGQSNRDYATLFRAVEGLPIPVTVVSADTAPFGGVSPPSNVTPLFNTGHDQTNALIASATFHVIPLHPAGFSSGQTVLLRAMAAGKACVVSEVPGVQDYILPEQTALVVPPEDRAALRAAILRLWESPSDRERVGAAARERVEREFGFAGFLERLLEWV